MIDAIITICFLFIGVALVIGLPCFIFEKLDNKFNWNFGEKAMKFFSDSEN